MVCAFDKEYCLREEYSYFAEMGYGNAQPFRNDPNTQFDTLLQYVCYDPNKIEKVCMYSVADRSCSL